MIEVSIRCPCGTHATVDLGSPFIAEQRWICNCQNCLDPVEDCGPRANVQGAGASPEEAIAAWWALVEEVWEIDYEPNALFAELSEQAGDEADRTEGWTMVPDPDRAALWLRPAPPGDWLP